MNKFLKLLLGTTLYVLDQSDQATKKVRSRAADNLGDLRDFARDKYDVATDRFANASRAIRGDDSHVLGNALRLTAGVGIGLAIGLMFAPASGEETRSAIAGKVQDFGDKVKRQFASETAFTSEKAPYATGTNG